MEQSEDFTYITLYDPHKISCQFMEKHYGIFLHYNLNKRKIRLSILLLYPHKICNDILFFIIF